MNPKTKDMDLQKIENTNIYEFHSKGKLTEGDAENLTASFKEFDEKGQHINLLGVIDSMPFPKNLPALKETLKLKTNSLNVIGRYAILSDKDWLDNWVSVGNFFTPGIPMKSFNINDRDAAIAWLNEENVKEYNPEDYLTDVEVKKLAPNTYEFNIPYSKMDFAAMSALYNILKYMGEKEKLNLLVIFDSFPTFDSFEAFYEGMKIDLKALGHIDKYAIVSDSKWIEEYAKLGDFVTSGIEVKTFELEQLKQARNWVVGA